MQTSSVLSPLNALSPLDGRYSRKCAPLRRWLSEADSMTHWVDDEVAWLRAQSQAVLPDLPAFSEQAEERLSALVSNFSETDAARIKEIEAVTNHDMKAVEYWLKEKISDVPELAKAAEFIHFACTSEDINNTSHALMLGRARDQFLLPQLVNVSDALKALAHQFADQPIDRKSVV